MSLAVTSLYGAILGFLHIKLSFGAIGVRRRERIPFGVTRKTGEADKELEKAVRKHGNFTEHVPLTLLLLALAEARHAAPLWLLHVLGAGLCAARWSHQHSMGAPYNYRFFGTSGTLSVLGILAICLLVSSFTQGGALSFK